MPKTRRKLRLSFVYKSFDVYTHVIQIFQYVAKPKKQFTVFTWFCNFFTIVTSLKLFFRVLSEARELTEFPNLNGTSALEVLRIDRASIYDIPDTLCMTCPKLKSL